MTVKKLQEQLAEYAEDMPVYFQDTSVEYLQTSTFIGSLMIAGEDERAFKALVIGQGVRGRCQMRIL